MFLSMRSSVDWFVHSSAVAVQIIRSSAGNVRSQLLLYISTCSSAGKLKVVVTVVNEAWMTCVLGG